MKGFNIAPNVRHPQIILGLNVVYDIQGFECWGLIPELNIVYNDKTPPFQAMNTINNIQFWNQLRTPNIRQNGHPAIYQQKKLRKLSNSIVKVFITEGHVFILQIFDFSYITRCCKDI